MKRIPLVLAAALVSANSAYAVDGALMTSFYTENIAGWANDPVLIDAIVAQNVMTANYDSAMIDQLDQTWRAEVGTGSTPTIDPVLQNAAADFLRDQVAASGGLITEVFIMDAKGLNVAASAVTSDYWQGDEAKFLETYPMGSGAMHFSDIEFDESSQSYQAQVSVTLSDGAGNVIGAMTVGIIADALM